MRLYRYVESGSVNSTAPGKIFLAAFPFGQVKCPIERGGARAVPARIIW
jgi:hypothetical protein